MHSPNPTTPQIVFHAGRISREEREALLGQRGMVVWMTGLSGSGKSTIARALEAQLCAERRLVYVLDGDNLRHGLNSDLGFSEIDRQENVRRTGEVCALFVDAAVVVIAALISPFRRDRERVRTAVGSDRFVEVFVDVPLSVCESRDPKGLYAAAREGRIPQFTGITSPYEAPPSPDVTLSANEKTPEECAAIVRAEMTRRGAFRVPSTLT